MTNRKPFTERYFEWLITQFNTNPEHYRGLFRCLHSKEFIWFVPNDDNRLADAMDIREDFWRQRGRAREVPLDGVSVLEVIVALSRRMAFLTGDNTNYWAWIFVENLGLDKMTDPFTKAKREQTEEILEALIWRTYQPNGIGGFFPMPHTDKDQTRIELWYQMNEYIQANALI